MEDWWDASFCRQTCLIFLAIKVIETICLDLTHWWITSGDKNLAWLCGTWEIILLFCGIRTSIKWGKRCVLLSKICCKIWFMATWVKDSIGIVQHISLRMKCTNSINLYYHLIVNTQTLHAATHLESCKQVSESWKDTQKMCTVKWVWWLSSYFY